MATDLLENLNEQQREAIMAGDGPILVLAGPGSGKTRVLTHRIAYLIRELGIFPASMMAVTFTNKAAGEMRARVEKLLGGRLDGLQIGTFHAICARMLRREADHLPYSHEYLIYDTDDQIAVVKQVQAELNMDHKKFPPNRILGAISAAKNELVEPGKYASQDYFGEIVARCYVRYQQLLVNNNAMDFDDLLMQTVLLLRSNPAVAEKYQQRYEYLLVDEFQDTNTAQYELVRIMGKLHNNVFVVGDEDQGIYAFRGADYRNVLHFRRDYPDARVILLEQNYRSTQIVLDAARAVIDKNPHRTPKMLFTDRSGGLRVNIYEAYSDNEEAEYVVKKVASLVRDSRDYRDFAIMYRTNAQSRALEEACVASNIPYRLVGGVGFYKRQEVRDLLAYLRLVHNPNDTVSFNRVINVPARGIGKKSLETFQQWAAARGLSYSEALTGLVNGDVSPITGRASRSLIDFAHLLVKWRDMEKVGNLVALLDEIMTDISYNTYVGDISDRPEQANDRRENIDSLRSRLAENAELPLADFLADVALVADVDTLSADMNTVTLLTLHAAKGLEFPVVFITGLEEGLLPHMRSFDSPDAMAEERRLMYVGLTRAEDEVYLTYAFRRMMYGDSTASTPSRFLRDIPGDLTEGVSPQMDHLRQRQRFQEETTWDNGRDSRRSRGEGAASGGQAAPRQDVRYPVGVRVKHNKFGEGVVLENHRFGEDEEVVIAFKQVGIKRLAANFANLVILQG